MKAFRVVLVGPQYASNVGAAARAAANFDVAALWVVKPECRWREAQESKQFAKGPQALQLFENAREGTLQEALSGTHLSIGFTRRPRDYRGSFLSLSELPQAHLKTGGQTALVFGRENGGLSNEELSLCTKICSLAVSAENPSLNISHAVAVVCARIFEILANSKPSQASSEVISPGLISNEQIETVLAHWAETLDAIGVNRGDNAEKMLGHFRRFIQRAELDENEMGALRSFLSKTQSALKRRP